MDGKINISMKKTGNPVTIPVHPVVRKISVKYNYDFPVTSNQKMNVYLKEVGEAAKIEDNIIFSVDNKGKKETILRPKYELITTHTGRRSMVCNLYKAGVPAETIMRISGHKSHKQFMKYLRLTPEDHLDRVTGLEFFSPELWTPEKPA